jgi:hypothetical protein
LTQGYFPIGAKQTIKFTIKNSAHNKYNMTMLGCDDYIRELESKGYKVLEDSISTKIPLIP